MIDKPITIDFSKLVNNGYKAPYLPCLATQEVETKAQAFNELAEILGLFVEDNILYRLHDNQDFEYLENVSNWKYIKKALEVKKNDNKSNL